MSTEIDNKAKLGAGLKAKFNTASSMVQSHLAQQKEKELQDRLIDASLASGGDPGFAGRADRNGFQFAQRSKIKKEEEKKKRDFELVRMSIAALSRSIEKGLKELAENIQKGYDLAGEILKDIADTQNDIHSIEKSHEEFEEALKNKKSLKDENGQFKSKSIQELAERASKRLGKALPDYPAKLDTLLIMQMEHEKSKVLPTMARVNDKRSVLYDQLISGTRNSEKSLVELAAEHERLMQLPDGEEKQKEMQDLDNKENITNKEQTRLGENIGTENKNLKKEIEKVTENKSETNNEISIKRDDDQTEDFSFSPASLPSGVSTPKIGR